MTPDNELLLTPRWFAYPEKVMNHPVISAWRACAIQYRVVAAGRRSFKTETMKRRNVRRCIEEAGVRRLLGAPTRQQAKEIFWNDVKALSPSWLVKDKNESELWIEYSNGSKLYVVGLDAYERIEGIRWNGGGVTEYQKVHPDFFRHTLQPILNDTYGDIDLEGRPIGQNHFYDDSLRAQSDGERWSFFTWKSADIMSEQQIRDAQADLDPITFRQEYEASFEAAHSRAYYAFTDQYAEHQISLSYPIIIACDFNATDKPMSWTLGQEVNGITYWCYSFSHTYTNTDTMCSIVIGWIEKKIGSSIPEIIFYGDYSGVKQVSNSAFSDWQIIENRFRNIAARVETKKQQTKSIRDRVQATNARFLNALGERRQFVHPTDCKPLVTDLQRVQFKSNGHELDGSQPLLTHAADSISYYNMIRFPVYAEGMRSQLIR